MSDETRKISAILFSDIVGYTAAMGRDEEAAIQAVSRARTVQKELVRKHNGAWLQEIGDGAMCTFDSAVEAVRCALEIQGAFREDPDCQLRIGIHVGDLVFRKTEIGTDIFGDAVNVAARIQGVADAGGICVSERVHEDLLNRRGFETRFLGEKQLKNVNRPIRVYRVVDPEGREAEAPAEGAPATSRLPRLAAAAALAGLLVAGGFWWLTGSAPDRAPDARSEARPPAQVPQPAEPPVATSEPATRAPATRAPEPGEAPAPAGSEEPPPEVSELDEALAALTGQRTTAEPAVATSFQATRGALLGAVGPWDEAAARVWIEPDPVATDEAYHVRFEAQCDCAALLFAVDGNTQEIELLYPNPYEPAERMAPGEVREIPSPDAIRPYVLRAVGGKGMDILKLFVVEGSPAFPPRPGEPWAASPAKPERLAELEAFLDDLDGAWATADTPLRIFR